MDLNTSQIKTDKKQKGVSSSVNHSKKVNGNRSNRDFSIRSARQRLPPGLKKNNKQIDRKTFTVIGNRVTKDFIYCVKMLQGLHKYRRQHFGAPIIRGVTGVEWPHVLNELKKRYGESALQASGDVVILQNGYYLGGAKELKDLIEEKYIYFMAINYAKESIHIFKHFVKLTGRGCAYMHICVDDEPIGSFIFLLYSDICPKTCENFSRLCHTTKGGYSGTPIHRIVEDGWIQCGGFALKDVPLGCENFVVPHDRRGVLGMCNGDRSVDCSTQFFILLQPALWMNHKYVAFGQLIDGEETLKKIEQIPTFYESPAKKILIYKAGLLNLDCDDIMVNRGAVGYTDQHIDDLVSIQEMLREWIWQLVETDIEARELKAEVMGIDSQGLSGILAPQSEMTPNEDSYPSIVGEEEQLPCLSVPPSVIEKRPYYIPLTDVPYPGERDSNFDLKRFLQGAYCLESDLDPQQPKEIQKGHKEKGNDFNAISGIWISYSQALQVISDIKESSSSSSEDENELDECDRKAVEDYLRENGEKASFGGNIVKSIGKTYLKRDLLQYPEDTFADEEIRRIRLALHDLKVKEDPHKKVSIGISPWDVHTQIKRRQTGFKPLPNVNTYDQDERDEDDEDKKKLNRSVIISEDARLATTIKIQRRQTGYVRSYDSDEVESTERTHVDDDDDEERPSAKKMSVRATRSEVRPSVLIRLYDEAVIGGSVPILKDFKPMETIKKDSLDRMEEAKGYLRKDTHPFFTQYSQAEEAAERATTQPAFHPGRKRPTLTISAYKLKNKMYAEKMKNETKEKQNK